MLGLTAFTTNTAAGNVTAIASPPIFSSNPIQRGLNVGLFDRLENTSSHKANLNITITATTDCDANTYLIGSTRIGFNAGETKVLGISWPVPSDACAGNYTVTWAYAAGNSEITSASGTLVVTN